MVETTPMLTSALAGFWRLLLAAVAGGLIGLEREIHGRGAGFRTNILVCVGSALAMLVSLAFAEAPWSQGSGYSIAVNPGQIAYGVMTGIGFLGAGAIIRDGARIHGLTTAAAIWAVAAIGLAAGFGLYQLTAMAAGLVLVVLWILHYVEIGLPRQTTAIVKLHCASTDAGVKQAVDFFTAAGCQISAVRVHRGDSGDVAQIRLEIEYVIRKSVYQLALKYEQDGLGRWVSVDFA